MKNLKLVREEALQFVADKDIAIAGASRNPKKFGNVVYQTLKSKGLNVYPLNPNIDTLGSDVCYRSLQDLPANVKNLLVLLKPDETEKIIKDAIAKGITKVWIQQGSESAGAIKVAQEGGLNVITGKCILMYANPTGFHKFHMRMNKLFGKY
jgi:predicted CoA-binding protein